MRYIIDTIFRDPVDVECLLSPPPGVCSTEALGLGASPPGIVSNSRAGPVMGSAGNSGNQGRLRPYLVQILGQQRPHCQRQTGVFSEGRGRSGVPE